MRRREVRRLVLPAALVSALVITALLAPVLPLTNPVQMEVAARLAPPSAAHILGQDEYGRDVLSRIVWGARVSLSVALLAAVVAGVLGTVLGLLGGYFRGLVELVTIRPAEAILCFPPILLALLVVTLLGPGAVTLVLALSFLYAPAFARVAYAETLTVRGIDFVIAQEALGARASRILARTMLPNVAPPLIVQFSLTVASPSSSRAACPSRTWRGVARSILGTDDPRRAWDHGAGPMVASVALHRPDRRRTCP